MMLMFCCCRGHASDIFCCCFTAIRQRHILLCRLPRHRSRRHTLLLLTLIVCRLYDIRQPLFRRCCRCAAAPMPALMPLIAAAHFAALPGSLFITPLHADVYYAITLIFRCHIEDAMPRLLDSACHTLHATLLPPPLRHYGYCRRYIMSLIISRRHAFIYADYVAAMLRRALICLISQYAVAAMPYAATLGRQEIY